MIHYNIGVPSISVICDGGWSKRTHKHSYNAMGGVGVIIGAKTKKTTPYRHSEQILLCVPTCGVRWM